jgi:hypothetical protein
MTSHLAEILLILFLHGITLKIIFPITILEFTQAIHV